MEFPLQSTTPDRGDGSLASSGARHVPGDANVDEPSLGEDGRRGRHGAQHQRVNIMQVPTADKGTWSIPAGVLKLHGDHVIPRSLPSDPNALPPNMNASNSCNMSPTSTPTTSFFEPFSPLSLHAALTSREHSVGYNMPEPPSSTDIDQSSLGGRHGEQMYSNMSKGGHELVDSQTLQHVTGHFQQNDGNGGDDDNLRTRITPGLDQGYGDEASICSDPDNSSPNSSPPSIASVRSGISEDDDASSNDLDEQPTQRVVRSILSREFNLRLGHSEPPPDALEAVRACLDRISRSLQMVSAVGSFVPAVSYLHGSGSTGGARSAPSGQGSGDTTYKDHPGSGGMKPLAPHPGGSGNGNGASRGDDEDDNDTRGGQHPPNRQGDGDGATASAADPNKNQEFPCPFRMRKPWRFNFREWQTCAKARFKNISEVKRHICQHHMQQPFIRTCVRCDAGFTRDEDWLAHMLADNQDMCAVRPRSSLADEVISKAIADRLRKRSEHFDWPKLWRTLFPGDQGTVPEPAFHPIVELPEVEREYASRLPAFRALLKSQLDSLLSPPMLQTLLSGWDTHDGRDTDGPRDFVFQSLETLFRDSVEAAFRGALEKATGAPMQSISHDQQSSGGSGRAFSMSGLPLSRGTLSSQSSPLGPHLSLLTTIASHGSPHSSIWGSNISSPVLSTRYSGNSMGSSHTSMQSAPSASSSSRPLALPRYATSTTVGPVESSQVVDESSDNINGETVVPLAETTSQGVPSQHSPAALEVSPGQKWVQGGGVEESLNGEYSSYFRDALGEEDDTRVVDVTMPIMLSGTADMNPMLMELDKNAG